MDFFEETFYQREINLDFSSFTNCRFENCRLIYHGHAPISLINCEFADDTRVHFDGPAWHMFNFLSECWRNGNISLVEGVWLAITSGDLSAFGPPHGDWDK